LPAEPDHERTITKSINALLLETAQAMDETAGAAAQQQQQGEAAEDASHRKTVWRLAALTREGAEWLVSAPDDKTAAPEGWGTQHANEFAGWMRYANEAAHRLTEKIEAGPLSHVLANDTERNLILLPEKNKTFLAAWAPGTEAGKAFEQTKKIISSWDS
jgi:hypothetical protein